VARGPGGEVAEGGLPPMPRSARVCVGWPQASEERERGLARAGTGRWGTGVSPGRWGGADWGCWVERVREREGDEIFGQYLPRELPSLSICMGQGA
jgi:hypothetical protein